MPLTTQVFQRLFGLALLSFVLMGTGLIPWQPPPVAIRAEPLRDAIFSSGYIIPAVLIVYLLSGLAFVSNRFVALGCLVLFPVSLNILLFHGFLNPRSVPLALAVFVPNVLLMWTRRAAYRPLLK